MAKIAAFIVAVALPLLPSQSQARDSRITLVRAASANNTDFEAFVAGEAKYQTYADSFVTSVPSASAREQLKNLLTRAQSEYLSGSLVVAQKTFREIMELAHSEDWGVDDQEAFRYSAMRLAQTSTAEDERKLWLRRAAGIDAGTSLQTELFPPPLVDDYQRAVHARRREMLDLDLMFPEFKYLLVDGRKVEIAPQAEFLLDEEVHRFTLVGNQSMPVSKSMSWRELKVWSPSLKIFAAGSCDQPIFTNTAALPANAEMYFEDDCLRRPNETARANQPQLSPGGLQPVNLPLEHEAKPPSIISGRQKWLWLTLGAGVLALAAYEKLHQGGTEPSTTYGF